jgi:hypothetical protein
MLVEKGADIAKKDKDGDTPLDIAINKRHRDVIDYLISIITSKKLDIKHPILEREDKDNEFLKTLGDTDDKRKEKLVEFLNNVCFSEEDIFTFKDWNEFDLEDLLQIILYEPTSNEVFYISDLDINNSSIKHHCYNGEYLLMTIRTKEQYGPEYIRDPMTTYTYTPKNIRKIKNNLLGGSKNTNKTLEIYIPNKKLKNKKNKLFGGLKKIGTLVVSNSLLKTTESTKKQPTKTKESTKKQPTKTKESTKKQPTKTKESTKKQPTKTKESIKMKETKIFKKYNYKFNIIF